MPRAAAFLFLFTVVVVGASRGQAAPVVPGVTHAANTVDAGRLLLGGLSCTACHEPGDAASHVVATTAPDLREVARRADPRWLARFIAAPSTVKPGTTMPDVLAPRHGDVAGEVALDIVHWLRSLTRRPMQRTVPDLGAALRGEASYHQVGCVACHEPTRVEGDSPRGSVPLTAFVGEKYGFDGLWRFLRDPTRIRPAGRMPNLSLSDREARDIAHFLLRKTVLPGTLSYAMYRKKYETLDAFEKEAPDPERTGLCDAFDPKLARRGNDFVLRFDGFLKVPHDGTYTFHVNSDDGSRLWIDSRLVVDNDGHRRNQKAISKSGRVELKAGWRALRVTYFQRVRNTVLEVAWAGPGLAKRPIGRDDLRSTRNAVSEPEPFRADPTRVVRGREAFASEGCGSCHQADAKAQRPSDTHGLVGLDPDGGCLSEAPPARAVRYPLDPGQRNALRAALRSLPTRVSTPPHAQRITDRLLALNCYACHERDGAGGPAESRDPYFTSGGINQGVEGRIPPRLTGVGDKLKQPWLKRVLTEGAAVRPLFHTRMPRYGATPTMGLAEDFVRVDRKPSTPPRVNDDPVAQKTAGRRLVGMEGGFNCVACHHFNGRVAATMQMSDLVGVTERIHEDWFQRWIRDPGTYNPGTRMPTYLPHEEVLGKNLDRQFAAIWTYLSDGRRALAPQGVSRQSLELIVGGEAVVYRGKLRDAGMRGIAVGHPELVHFAYDAEEMRHAVLWKGRFLNVAGHWRSQGMGRIGVHGHDPIRFPKGSEWARLPTPESPWPAREGRVSGQRFRGYRLDKLRRPTFRLALGDVSIEDFTRAIGPGQNTGLLRTVTLSSKSPPDDLWLRLAGGPRIADVEGGHSVGDKLVIKVNGAAARAVGDGAARTLRVPLRFRNGKARIEVEYRW
ncbi:MAG: hypothetical protein CMJ83_20430 [Planctomycetes bacterium]|nr:hypothetical protein [Planctomycetota bacterium]